MDIQNFSNDLFSIIRKDGRAQNLAMNYYQTICSTSHLFLATFGFLAGNKDSERYKGTYDKLRGILNGYGINGKTFETSFLQFFPKGKEPEEGAKFIPEPDRETQLVISALRRNVMSQQRTMEVEDLILELFADKSYTIYTIFTDITKSDMKSDEMYNAVIKAFKKQMKKVVKELEELPELTNLNSYVTTHPQHVFDMEDSVKKLEMALAGRSVNSAMLIGKAGTGKTQTVMAFAQDIVNGNVPEIFADKIIYQLDATALMSGTKFRGDLEEKLVNILDVVKQNPHVILFVDEIHMLMKMNGQDDGGQSVGNMLKPYLSRNDIQLIGCTTNEEFTKIILPDKAFSSRFSLLTIEEPTKETTKKILQGLLPVENEFFKKEIQDQLVDRVLDVAEKYALEYANPRKSINMLELACAYSKVFEENKQIVDVDDVIHSIKLRYNIYVSDNKLDDTEKDMKEKILGQDEPIKQVLRDLELVEAGLTDPHRPAFSMLLCGPSGYTIAPLF